MYLSNYREKKEMENINFRLVVTCWKERSGYDQVE